MKPSEQKKNLKIKENYDEALEIAKNTLKSYITVFKYAFDLEPISIIKDNLINTVFEPEIKTRNLSESEKRKYINQWFDRNLELQMLIKKEMMCEDVQIPEEAVKNLRNFKEEKGLFDQFDKIEDLPNFEIKVTYYIYRFKYPFSHCILGLACTNYVSFLAVQEVITKTKKHNEPLPKEYEDFSIDVFSGKITVPRKEKLSKKYERDVVVNFTISLLKDEGFVPIGQNSASTDKNNIFRILLDARNQLKNEGYDVSLFDDLTYHMVHDIYYRFQDFTQKPKYYLKYIFPY